MATLNDLRIKTRLRLGELTPGTFGIEDYEGKDDVDEVKLALNSAQVEVCRDIFTQQFMPFRRLQSTLPLFSEQAIYTLPRDYIQMVSVYHKKNNSEPPLQLTPKILDKYREQDYHQYTSRTYNYLNYYEVSGQIGEVLAEGTVTWTDGSQLAADNVSLTKVRVGDIVQNLTDNSQGIITNFGSGIASLDDGLHGGRSNRLQFGDEFLIQSREESRFALETWPTLTLPEIKTKVEQVDEHTRGGSIFFIPTEDTTIETINIRIPTAVFQSGGALENYNPQTRLILYLRRVIDPTANTFEYETIDTIGWQNAKAGINELSVLDAEINKGKGHIQINRGETYEVFLATEGFGLIIDFTINDLELLQPPTDHLIINYVKRPAEFIIEESICELYDELHELVVEKAVLTLLRKKDSKMINGSILQYYKTLVEEGKEFLANLLPPDNMSIDTEVPGLSTHTPDFSSWYW